MDFRDYDCQDWTDDQLKEMLATHECTLTPDGGCECLKWEDIINQRLYEEELINTD